MGYHLNHLDEPVLIRVLKPLLTDLTFIIYWRVMRAIESLCTLHKELAHAQCNLNENFVTTGVEQLVV